MFFYLFCGAVAFLLSIAVGVATLIHLNKRKPALEAEFATKAEVISATSSLRGELHREVSVVNSKIDALDSRNEAIAKQIFAKIDQIAHSFDTGMREVHRALGRLEGDEK